MFKKNSRLKVVIFESVTGFRWQVWDGEDILGVSPQGFPSPTACLEDWLEAGKQIAWFIGGGCSRPAAVRLHRQSARYRVDVLVPRGSTNCQIRGPLSYPKESSESSDYFR